MKNRRIMEKSTVIKKTVRSAMALSLAVMVLALFIITLLSFDVSADGLTETEQNSLTVKYYDGDDPIPGALFDIYRVGYLGDDYKCHLTERFERYPVDFESMFEGKGDEVAAMLAAYIQRDDIKPLMSKYTDKDGYARFAPLESGVYLVIGHQVIINGFVYKTIPFMTVLPSIDPSTGEVSGNLTVVPKRDKDPIIPPGDHTTMKKVLKIWDDSGFEANRPESIKVQLLRNGVIYQTVVLNADNNWRYTWDALPMYDENGVMINWTVVEVGVPGYTVSITQEGVTFVVTNSIGRQPEKEVSVEKIWEDEGFEEDRPSSIVVWLLKNGEVYDSAVLSQENGWNYTWSDLPEMDENGRPIVWRVIEEAVHGYTGETSGIGNPFYIVNKHDDPEVPPPKETTERTVHKIWQTVDENGRILEATEIIYPESVVIRLYGNGHLYSTVVLDSASEWTYKWSELPMYDSDGSLIIWTIDEIRLNGYVAEITEENGVFTVRNTIVEYHHPEDKEDLPQTGMLWWPVPVLAGLGAVLVLAGSFIKKSKS